MFGSKRLPASTDLSPIGPWTARLYPAQFQPGPAGEAHGQPPPDHLLWAVLAARLGFTPLGLVALVYASQVNNKWAAGDVAGAHEASQKAKAFAIWAALVPAALIAVVVGAMVLAVSAMLVVSGFASGSLAG